MMGSITTRAMAATAILALLSCGAGCAGKKKKSLEAAFLSAEGRYTEGLRLLEQRDLRKAKKALAEVDFGTSELREVYEPMTRLAIADTTFFMGDDLSLIDARSLYLDFVTLYGDHPKAPYAQLQAGTCSLKQVNHPSRDQTQTLEAIRDLREVERRYPTSPYARIARLKIDEALANLAEHEFIVGRFYLKKKKYQAAANRMRGLLQRYPRYAEKEKVYFHLGKALVLSDNAGEGTLYLDKLLEDFPTGEYAKRARALLPAEDSTP